MHQESTHLALSSISDDALIRFTQDLIRINSVNPNLEAGSNEAEVVDFISRVCRQAGLQVTIEEVALGRPNLYCLLPGEEDGIGLALLCHTDTIPFLGMRNPLSGDIQNGYIWGRGSVDMKGGLSASIYALLALARSGIKLRKGLAVWAVIDEESEHRGAYVLEQAKFHADACIVTEPSDLNLLLGCKGTAPLRIDVEGVLAHGSTPWLGVNAIEKAAKIILALTRFKPKSIFIPELNMCVQGSVNIGVIQGGTQYNNVADFCSFFLDRRMVPGETQASVLTEINQILETLSDEDPQLKARVSISRPDWHWEPITRRGLNPAYTPPDSPLVAALQESYRKITGREITLGYTNGYMDMDFTVNGLGIPTVNFGPGETALSHSINERLRISDLLVATRVYILTALYLTGESI